MKNAEGYEKLRGGYYTPTAISKFITDWAIRSLNDTVLEPSCGDGSFLSAAKLRMKELGGNSLQIRQRITGVELKVDET